MEFLFQRRKDQMIKDSLKIGVLYEVKKQYYVGETFDFAYSKSLWSGDYFIVLKMKKYYPPEQTILYEILNLKDGKKYYLMYKTRWSNALSEGL